MHLCSVSFGDALGFCPVRFGVLFCSVILGCRYTPYYISALSVVPDF